MKSAAAILILLLLTCCELVTEIDVPEPPRMAVVNSIFNSDSTWLVDISTSDHILSDHNFKVENAQVLLTDETGQQIDLTELDPFDTASHFPILLGKRPGAVYASNSRPQPGMTYRIEVRGSNVPTATATARTPIATALLDVKIDSAHSIELREGDFLGLAIPVEFTIEDPPGVPDTYYPRMFQVIEYKRYDRNKRDTVITRTQQFIQLFKDIPGTGFIDTDGLEGFSDGLFDGKRHRTKLYMVNFNFVGPQGPQGPQGKVISLRLYLNHVDETYSRYFRSLQLQENARDNPFAQPVQVFSNVEGGLGIFSGSASSYWEFVR